MKTLFAAAVAFMLSMSSYAQQKIFTFGAEGGISIASLSYDNKTIDDFYKSRTGYAAGVALQYNFPKIFSLRSGAMFEMKGTSSDITFTDMNGSVIGNGELKYNLGYLTVPLLLRATFGNKINFFLDGGPYWASLLSAKLAVDPAPQNINPETDVKYQFESSEFGVSGGIGASAIFNEIIVLSVEVRNNSGITDIWKDVYKVRTRSLLFLAGVALTVGSREE